MESKTYIKNIRISPKKLRFMVKDIKKRKPAEALHHLNYASQKGGKVFYKAIHSALANAKNSLKADENLIEFKTLLVEEGQKLKRFQAGGRGTIKPYVRKLSHIKIVLTAPVVPKSKLPPAKKEAGVVKPSATDVKSKSTVKSSAKSTKK